MVESQIRPRIAPSRLAPELPFPSYAYVPGRHPHPARGAPRRPHIVASVTPGTTLGYGLDLFNYGYYWEAHEAWEALWRAQGRHSPEGQLLLGLIALAAAGVKAREGNPRGVIRHARRAAGIFRKLIGGQPVILELSLATLTCFAEEITAKPPGHPAEKRAPPEVVFAGPLMLS